MPLLNKEPFVPVPVPHDLSPDDEVFYLPLTDEIFTSHDAFFERSILTNSLVWTCSVSGKSPLTYEEALESESQSKILIQTFPKSMQIPILYLMRYITTSASRDICDMIYIFVCNRYFLGETVEIIKNDLKLSGQIIQIISPTEDQNTSSNECLGQTVSYGLDPHLYKYQVKVTGGQEKIALLNKIKQTDALKLDNEDQGGISEVVNDNSSLGANTTNDSDNDDIIVDASCIIRPKGIFSKDRLRLFLRHHLAETKRNQTFDIKAETKELYKLNDVSWTDFFAGPEPKFDRKNNIVVKIKEPTLNKDISNKVIKQIKEGEDSQRKRKISEIEADNGEEQPLKKKKKKKKSEGAENSSDANVETPNIKKKKKKKKDGEYGGTESSNEGATDKSKKKGSDGTETPAHTPKKKKYPYDPHKYDMPVPEGIDPDLLTSTGKIDGRKLKNKKNKDLAEELLATKSPEDSSPKKRGPKPGSAKKKSPEKDPGAPEKSAKKKSKTPAEIAKEKELEAKRKKEALMLAKQQEKQKREEERKAIAAFLQEWEKKCEDLERDDLRPLPTATPIDCDIPQEHFGDAIYIMEVFYNLHEIFSDFKDFCPTGIDFDTLEEILLDKNDDSALGTVVQYLLSTIFRLQPSHEGLGVEDETKESAHPKSSTVPENSHPKSESISASSNSDQIQDGDQISLEADNTEISVDGVSDIDEDDHNKEIDMNDLIGSAIKAAQDVQASIKQPLYDIDLDSNNVTEVLRLHLLQSGTYPKSRSVYNGWYSAREDPGLWLCMQEPELIKKLSDTSIFDLNMDERIKLIHALINQIFSFIGTRAYIETANERLNELRKEYRAAAAAFARWDRENCVKKLQQPKRKNDQVTSIEKSDNEAHDQDGTTQIKEHQEANTIVNTNGQMDKLDSIESDPSVTNEVTMTPLTNGNIKSCLKINGHVQGENGVDEKISFDEPSKKKITFNLDSAILTTTERKDVVTDSSTIINDHGDEQEPTFEDLEKVYEENLVAYDEYQIERSRRLEEHNTQLIHLRAEIRNVQSLYGVHAIGRDRAYRRYWLFQSLPGLFVEWDDTDFGPCLEATPTESRFKLKFNRDNPSDPQSGTCKSTADSKLINKDANHVSVKESIEDGVIPKMNGDPGNVSDDHPSNIEKSGPAVNDDKRSEYRFEEMARCSGNESTCVIHGRKNSENQSRWWFYHSAESIDCLIDTLNKRGNRESELLETLVAERSTIREWVSDCPAFKLNKLILEQSGIRRSRRLRQKTHKRRTRAMSYE